ncbi:MAG: Ig-like domain-containing protein, partial [Dokdonia sp.]
MDKNYLTTNPKIAHFLYLLLVLGFWGNATAQTQAPSIRTGVTFDWEETSQPSTNSPATIKSISIDGTLFNTFVVPSGYQLTRLGPDGNGDNSIRKNGNQEIGNSGTATLDITDSTPWDDKAKAAFQDKNLNHYFEGNPNGRSICNDFSDALTTDAQEQTIYYDPAIPSNEDGILAVTERGGNNCFYIELWGIPVGGGSEQLLGETFVRNDGNYTGAVFGPPINDDTDYWRSGRTNDNNQTIGIALFELNDIAPTGSLITRIEFIAATRDHGDGKFFLLQKYAVDQIDLGCVDGTINGDLNTENNVPAMSTYSLLSGPTPAGVSFTLNTDGTYTYEPSPSFTGDVVFEYEVCLPAPNPDVCDTGLVTMTYVDRPAAPTVDLNCSSSGLTDLVITAPLGSEFEYSINGGTYQSSPVFADLPEGTYDVMVIDTNTNCENANATTIVISNLEIALPITVVDAGCFGESTGAIDLEVSGGLPPYTYSWSNGETTEDITDLAAGTYTVEVTDAYGCTISSSAQVGQPNSNVSLTGTVVDINCNNEATGEIDITVGGGTPPYAYSWSNGDISEDIDSLTAGTYTVVVTDDNGCTLTETFEVTEPDSALSLNITKVNATTAQGCTDGQASANVSGGTPPYTYQWGPSAANQTTQTATNLDDSQPHQVLVTDANGCEITQSVVINCIDNCDAVIAINSVTDLACNGDNSGAAQVSASSIANPGATFTFTWSNGFSQAGVTSSTLQTTTGGGVAAGVYTVSVTIDGTVCLAVEQTVSITQPDALSVGVTSTDETGPGLSNGTATASGNGGTPPYAYAWSNGDNTAAVTGLAPGNYTVTITDANNCTATNSVTINPGSCLDLDITAIATDVDCNGNSTGSATSTTTGGSDPSNFSYSWSNGATTEDISGVAAGSYTVVVTDSLTGCTAQTTVQISEPNSLSGGIAASNVLCFGESTGSLNLAVNGGTSPYSYLWNTGATDEDLIGLAAGTYTVTITDANGCTTTATGTITQPSTAVSVDVVSTNENGETANDGTATATASGGTPPYSYSWDNGETTAAITDLDSGTYTVTVTDGNGCQVMDTVTISSSNQLPLPLDDSITTPEDTAVSIFVTANDDFGADGPSSGVIVITTPPSNGVAVVNTNGTPSDPTDDFIEYTPAANFNGTDTLFYQIEDANGDTAVAKVTIVVTPVADAIDDVAITDEDVPVTIDVLDNDTFTGTYGTDYEVTSVTDPQNGTVTINPDGSVIYTPNPNYNGTDTFDYTVTITNPDGSTSTEMATVVVTVLPKADVQNDVADTPEDTAVNIDILPNDDFSGVYGVDYETTAVSDPANGTVTINPDGTVDYTPGFNFNGTDSFDYTVTVTNADGSTETETASVVVTVTPVVDAFDDTASTDEDVAVVIDV